MIWVSISDALSNGINRYHENVHNDHSYNSLHFTTSYIIIPKEWMCILRVLTMIQGEVDYVNRIKMNQLMHNNWIKRIYFKKLFYVKTIALIYIPSTSFNKEMLLYWGSKSYHMNYSEIKTVVRKWCILHGGLICLSLFCTI